MTAMMRVPRTRGAGSGLVLILLGAWGALIPFVGPYFHFAYTPDAAWTWTWGRFFLEIVPGVATVLGGLILLISAFRPVGTLHVVAEHLSFFAALGVVIVFVAAVAFGRLAVIGARDAQLAAGGDVTWDKTSEGAGKLPKPDGPADQDGERPSVWRRLTPTR